MDQMRFRKFDGTPVLDAGAYIVQYLKDNPGAKITVGCDSKQRRDNTLYVTVICLQSGTRGGVHVIYAKDTTPRQRDLFTRLWGEVERSKAVADVLMKRLLMDYSAKNFEFDIHLDLNPDPKHKSNPAYQAGMGYMTGSGYSTTGKPAAWAASYCADLLCK